MSLEINLFLLSQKQSLESFPIKPHLSPGEESEEDWKSLSSEEKNTCQRLSHMNQ